MRCGSPGFRVDADNVTLDLNSSSFANAAGFLVVGNAGANTGNTLTRNKALGSSGQGFAVVDSAGGTTLTGNSAAKHRVDYCDTTGASTTSANLFSTTSTSCDVLQ